ncbi:Nif11-like leader peptide family natural product precursor [Synechococcus sp. RS9916]|uniref:Nif11-like leader peptide family natural product precursor n=1 Tax=Synechococcus sp. RS9916 TaxID=221359 RepID=UPI0000E53777|nr:Nif11-like leader peptide family natural product precursor [Synechococcus sp. RS9916]EAU74595.1 hypothetical protein RS9916_33847 [Synechococcus sp. RS9916]
MSEEQLKAFLEKVKADTSLQDRLKAAKSQDEVVSIAKEHGHDFGTEHISQLSEKELEGVSGGNQVQCNWKNESCC